MCVFVNVISPPDMDQMRREHFQHKEKQNLGQDFNLNYRKHLKAFSFHAVESQLGSYYKTFYKRMRLMKYSQSRKRTLKIYSRGATRK